MVYGKNLLGPLDLSPLLQSHSFSGDADEWVKQLKTLHEMVSQHIEKQNKAYNEQANKKRKKQLFKVGDLVWVYLKKGEVP